MSKLFAGIMQGIDEAKDYFEHLPKYEGGCGGPSKAYAEERGNKIATELLALLKEKHGIGPLPEECPAGFPEGYWAQLRREWKQLESRFRDNVKEMVWTVDAEG